MKTKRTINDKKIRRAIAVAYDVNPRFIPEEIEGQFITYRKAA